MLEVQSISKNFKGSSAVKDVSFKVERGDVYGLLGHNGAGKSTSLGVVLGMVSPDAGEVFIDGISVQKNRSEALSKVGAIFEAPGFYEYLSGWENLCLLMDYSGCRDELQIEKVVDWVGLSSRIKDKVQVYSHGMKQRLALAQALLPMPEILLLDEPTDGLDPQGIKWFRDFILKLRAEYGITVLLNSHLLSEVEQMCDKVAILNEGEKVYEGGIDQLIGNDFRYQIHVDRMQLMRELAEKNKWPMEEEVLVLSNEEDVSKYVATLVKEGLKVLSVVPIKRSLEDFYLSLLKSNSGE